MARWILVVLSSWLVTSAYAADELDPGGFVIDAGQSYLRPIDVDRDGVLEEGDGLEVSGIRIRLGAPGTWRLRSSRREGLLYRVGEDGSETLIGVEVNRLSRKPFVDLSAAQLSRLRGVMLDAWDTDIESCLAQLDPDRVCLTIRAGAGLGDDEEVFPPLPTAMTDLVIDPTRMPSFIDFDHLRSLTELRSLSVAMLPEFDLLPIERAGKLRYLDLRGLGPRNPNVIGQLKALEVLDLSWNDERPKDLGFVASLPNLRVFAVENCGELDLRPLEKASSLESLHANMTRVTALPDASLPRLRYASLMSTGLSPEAMGAFRERNPDCAILSGWKSQFVEVVKGADRIRVRSGGTCHREPSQEKTLFEVEGVGEFLARLEIQEDRSGFHCRCCGEPTFEFYSGETLVAVLGFHHGDAVRWPDQWPGDAALTRESSAALCQWLADHGVRGPMEALEQSRRDEKEAQRKQAAIERILTKEVFQELQDVRSLPDLIAIFEREYPEVADRGRLYFALYGSHEGPWNIQGGMDGLLNSQLIPSIPKDIRKQILSGPLDTLEPRRGGARLLFGDRAWDDYDSSHRDALVRQIGPTGLESARRYNRFRTLEELGVMSNRASLDLLRRTLAGEFRPRPLPPGAEPDDLQVYLPKGRDIDPSIDESTYAALLLARRGDRESLSSIQERAKTATGENEKLLKRALELLEK